MTKKKKGCFKFQEMLNQVQHDRNRFETALFMGFNYFVALLIVLPNVFPALA